MDINRFCNPKDPRYYLRTPWIEDGKTIATDGVILVVLDTPVDQYLESDPIIRGKALPMLTMELGKFSGSSVKWHTVSALGIPKRMTCKNCNGSGKITDEASIICPECNGDGEFVYGSHTYECAECDGDGLLMRSEPSFSECPACAGIGYKPEACSLLGGTFQLRYLDLLKGLPNCIIATDRKGGSKLVFKFDGGAGMLMSMIV
ncbi:MAG: hypothetical protein AB7T01_02475 [Acidithiobacillus sp.]